MPTHDGSEGKETIQEAAIRLAEELGRSVGEVMSALTAVVLMGK